MKNRTIKLPLPSAIELARLAKQIFRIVEREPGRFAWQAHWWVEESAETYSSEADALAACVREKVDMLLSSSHIGDNDYPRPQEGQTQ